MALRRYRRGDQPTDFFRCATKFNRLDQVQRQRRTARPHPGLALRRLYHAAVEHTPRRRFRQVGAWTFGRARHPWQPQMCLVLQSPGTTSSHIRYQLAHRTASCRQPAAALRSHAQERRRSLPRRRLKVSGPNHRDERSAGCTAGLCRCRQCLQDIPAAIPTRHLVATSTTPSRSEEKSNTCHMPRPLPRAEKCAAIAREEAIEKKCAQAIQHFLSIYSEGGAGGHSGGQGYCCCFFPRRCVRVSLSEIRDRIRLILKEREEGDDTLFQHPLVAGANAGGSFHAEVLPWRCFGMLAAAQPRHQGRRSRSFLPGQSGGPGACRKIRTAREQAGTRPLPPSCSLPMQLYTPRPGLFSCRREFFGTRPALRTVRVEKFANGALVRGWAASRHTEAPPRKHLCVKRTAGICAGDKRGRWNGV